MKHVINRVGGIKGVGSGGKIRLNRGHRKKPPPRSTIQNGCCVADTKPESPAVTDMPSHHSPPTLSLYGRLGPWLTVLDDYQVGQDVHAKVVGRIEYGVLVELGTGVVALMNRKEIDWTSVDPMQTLQMGEEINVRILSIDPERKRMSVSRRALLPNPQNAFVLTAREGEVYLGTVKKCMDYGAFVEIAPGVRGLLHVSEMVAQGQGPSASSVCSPGDGLRVRVIGLDHDSRRISLAMAWDATTND